MPLFGKKKTNDTSPSKPAAVSQNETSYFGKNLMIKGRVSGNGNVIILGGLDGEFHLRGRVKIAELAKIKGEVKADVISVNANVKGKLAAQQHLHLQPRTLLFAHSSKWKIRFSTRKREKTMTQNPYKRIQLMMRNQLRCLVPHPNKRRIQRK